MNYSAYSSSDVWKKVGGWLYWKHLEGQYVNSCALRVSRALLMSGIVIPKGEGRNKNTDYVAPSDIGDGIRKGDLLKAEKAGGAICN